MLLLGLATNHLLSVSLDGTAAANLTAWLPISVLLGGGSVCFACLWPVVRRVPWANGAFCLFMLLLLCCHAAESLVVLLRLYRFTYGAQITLWAVLLMSFPPLLYLKSRSAVTAAGELVLMGLTVGALVFLAVVFSQLRVQELSVLQKSDWKAALFHQGMLFPEYLFPAFWWEGKRAKTNAALLPAVNLGVLCGLYFVLELLFGAGLPERMHPVHAAASLGIVSVFERTEWLLLLLCTLAVSVRIALFLLTAARLLQKESLLQKGAGIPLVAMLLTALLCAVIQNRDLEEFSRGMQLLQAGMMVLVVLVGCVRWPNEKQGS